MTAADLIQKIEALCAEQGRQPSEVRVYVDGYMGGQEDLHEAVGAWFQRDYNPAGSYSGPHERVAMDDYARWISINGGGRPPFRPAALEEMTADERAAWEAAKASADWGIYLPGGDL